MGQKGHRICEILLQYLQDESKTKRNIDLNLLEWTHYSMKPHEIPQQLNGSDCGMFTCKYADYISRDKPIAFTQHQMPLFRKKMVWEILHQQLLWECPARSSAAGGSFTDRRFHIPHALWVKKSLHHFCCLTGTELSEVHEGLSLHPRPDLVCGGLLATLFVRLCLLRALDYSTHARTNAN